MRKICPKHRRVDVVDVAVDVALVGLVVVVGLG